MRRELKKCPRGGKSDGEKRREQLRGRRQRYERPLGNSPLRALEL